MLAALTTVVLGRSFGERSAPLGDGLAPSATARALGLCSAAAPAGGGFPDRQMGTAFGLIAGMLVCTRLESEARARALGSEPLRMPAALHGSWPAFDFTSVLGPRDVPHPLTVLGNLFVAPDLEPLALVHRTRFEAGRVVAPAAGLSLLPPAAVVASVSSPADIGSPIVVFQTSQARPEAGRPATVFVGTPFEPEVIIQPASLGLAEGSGDALQRPADRRVIAVSSPDASWQTTGGDGPAITLRFEQTTTLKVEGASAAYSMDTGIARATASGGLVTLVGRAPGTTHVVITLGARVEFLRVTVADPPATTFGRFTPTGASMSDAGMLDVRYGSDLGILQSGLRLLRRQGDRMAELAVSAATAVGREEFAPFSLPLAAYTLRDAHREVTLMDKVVANSPLTVSRSNVRGLHWQEGPVQVHAGYSFFGTFEHLLLPGDREAVAGISYRKRVSPSSTVTPNLYYYGSSSSAGPANGAVGTVKLETEPFAGAEALAEVAVGGGTAGLAVDLRVSREYLQAWTNIRVVPELLPRLSTGQPAGRQIEAGVTRQDDAWRIDARANSQQYRLAGATRSSHVGRVDVARMFAAAVQVHAGSFFSIFDAGGSSRPSVQSVGVPVGLAATVGPVGLGLDYQWSRETDQPISGHLVRIGLTAARRGFSAGVTAERQTQVPTLKAAFSEQPTLQRELDRLGIAAGTPEELAEVLRANASLDALGYLSSVSIDLTPTRDRFTGNVTWTGPSRFQPRFELRSTVNRDALVTRTSHTSLHTATLTARVARGTEASLTWSTVCPDRPGLSRQCQPAVLVSLRQQVGRMAGLLSTGGAADISGVVFTDEQGLGRYEPGMATMPGIEVVLDGSRRAYTDADGRYRFRRVRAGRHRVEVRLPDGPSLYFTTASPADVEAGESQDFGIAAVQSRLRARVKSDAELPLASVILRAVGELREYAATTGADGVAPFDGLQAGTYDLQVDAASLPVGYYVASSEPLRATVAPSLTSLLDVVIRAARSIAGHLRVFDGLLGRYVPAPGRVVELHPSGLQSRTDREGRYVFRDLSAGEHTVVARTTDRVFSTAVTLPVGPAALTDIDISLAPELTAGRSGAAPPDTATSPPAR